MKLVNLVCPTCGAQLDVDMAAGQARCRFCKEIFQINDGTRDPEMSNAEQMGYDFERGRQRASVEFTQGFADRIAEARRHMPAMDPAPVYAPEPVYYEEAPAKAEPDAMPVWLIVLLWLVFPPAGLFATVYVLVRRARERGGSAAFAGFWGVVVMLWLIYAMIGIFF